jgi:hypothetical protein
MPTCGSGERAVEIEQHDGQRSVLTSRTARGRR